VVSAKGDAVREWIITGVLYVLGMGLIGVLGGIGAAGEALRSWGRISASLEIPRATYRDEARSSAGARNSRPGKPIPLRRFQ
jgi:hypothetical protein